jgi:cell division protein FtsI/penicillin-binding protein 2
MLDTLGVLRTLIAMVAVAVAPASCGQQQQAAFSTSPSWPAAVARALGSNPQARIVALDIPTGILLAAGNLDDAARTLAAPGSTIKPLALYGLVASGHWDPTRRIACNRKLTIAGRSLNCSHPPTQPMDARQALAWSCNTYFAAVAGALAPGELRGLLAPSGLLAPTGLASNEAIAAFTDPRTSDENRLTLLGVEGIRVTPLELALAYRWLAQQLDTHPDTPASHLLSSGLADSAGFGIAAAASLGGVSVAGKTGTANLGAGTPSHGWFAGWAPLDHPRSVIVVYLPAGHGANAAEVAAKVLANSPLRQPKP